MTKRIKTVETEATQLLELLDDWRAVYHATTGISHAFALAAFTNTIYHLGNSVAEGDWLDEAEPIQFTHQPPPMAYDEKES